MNYSNNNNNSECKRDKGVNEISIDKKVKFNNELSEISIE